jgi:nucleotide-binding universal stress UspA family protein
MIRSILVPLDGSTFAEHALPLAVWIARRAPASLQLVQVHRPVPPADIEGILILDDVELSMRCEENAYLDRVAHRLMEETSVPASVALLDGDVATAIQDRATAAGADLVVLSTHGRGTLGRFWLGSVADELVRRLPIPVLLVRPAEGSVDLDAPPAIESILIPLDGSPLAEQIIEPALALGGILGAAFTLVRVISPGVRLDYAPENMALERLADDVLERSRACQDRLRAEAQAYLDSIAALLRSQNLRVETCVVADEQPAVGILREAAVFRADLIALGTHGRRGLARLLLGSVADKVVRGGHLPVLLRRPTQG